MRAARSISIDISLLVCLLVAACGDETTPQDEPADASADSTADSETDASVPTGECDDFDPLRQPLFGDLHVHTALSLDANLQGTRLKPEAAYRFAQGEAIDIQPYDDEGEGRRTVQLTRPLDFAAVTDHAEFLGVVTACQDPESTAYDSNECRQYRDDPNGAFISLNALTAVQQGGAAHPRLCGEDGVDCAEDARDAWELIQEAAAGAHDDSSACAFTTFVGYEWSGGPGTENLHRNVIFRTQDVPGEAVSYFDEPYPDGLWAALRRDCIDADTGCDVLAIPHNSNLSNGRMFEAEDRDGDPIDATFAVEQLAMEPLVEIFQHKGDSECLPGSLAADELCSFEKMPYNSLATANLDINVRPNPRDFVRAAMGFGMELAESLGVNPFEYGFIASTDTHITAPGLAAENAFPGHGGAGQGHRDELPVGLPDSVAFNPGGLAVVWAEENTRDSIFEALRRRETYGTSGPRMTVRFFGGWGYPDDLCDDPDMVGAAYDEGVPMGGYLPETVDGAPGPTFVLSALRDPGAEATAHTPAAPGTRLQRVQIVKGWLEDGEFTSAVYDVAGDPLAGTDPGVDLTTCEPMDAGADTLCGVWTDGDFDPDQRAFYYARVVEIPTCRWTTHQCAAAGVDCDDSDTVGRDWESCCDDRFERVIQERAWTSPIWHNP